MKKIINVYIMLFGGLLLFSGIFSSCDATKDLDPGGTAVEEMAGDWFVQLLADDGSGNLVDIYGIGYFVLSTYNTAADVPTELFVDDHGLWPLKSVVASDVDAMTFSGNALSNEYDSEITATIANGLILPEAATTTGGNQSDSIYFKIEYSDDPGTEYFIAGYKRTGFFEDEH